MHRALLLFFVLWQVCRGADFAAFDIEFDKSPSEDKNSCQQWRSLLQSAYDEVAELVAAAIRDIEVVSQRRPDGGDLADEGRRRDFENWNRIDRNLLQFFGFTVDVNNPDPNSGYLKDVLGNIPDQLGATEHRLTVYVFRAMDETFSGTEARLHYDVQFGKPSIACGDKGWKYIAPGDIDPNDPHKRNLRDVEGREAFKDTGAWVWKSRYLWLPGRTTVEEPNLCRTDPTTKALLTQAVVAHRADLLTVCLREEDEPQPTIDRAEVYVGTELEDLTDPFNGVIMCVSCTMLHELTHLFGAWGNPMRDDWPNPDRERAVIDQPAVDEDGMLVYGKRTKARDGGEYFKDTTETSTNGEINPPKQTYLFQKVANLAITHPDNTNTGPGKSVNTAEAYAYFAVASLFSGCNWTGDGKAKRLEVNRDACPERPPRPPRPDSED